MKKTASLARKPSAASSPAGRVRIIGGQYRRTPIAVADVPGLRPTPDRVRETLFNWLAHLLGDFSRLRALDLFAGTGALGFELASRGASSVTLVECSPRAVDALRALRQRLDAGAVQVVAADWSAAVARLAPASLDLIFLDPPFDAGLLLPALEACLRLLAPGGLLYAESAQALEGPALAALGLEIVRADRAGAVHFHLLRGRVC